MPRYPTGKLSHAELAELLAGLPGAGGRDVAVGPRIGEDAAALAVGDQRIVVATDPVTFATDSVGWYAVHINANDVATMGAKPRWFQACVLMPPDAPVTVRSIFDDMGSACEPLGVAIVGGHTEVTPGVAYPIVVGTMMGVTDGASLLRTSGARVGDAIVLTKTAALEATAIIARQCADRLAGHVPRRLAKRAARFLYDPGISVVREAMIAARAGASSMHDPTEGGVIAGLWEMAEASGRRFVVDVAAIPIAAETRRVCEAVAIDPLRAIASGSLVVTIPADRVGGLLGRLKRAGVEAAAIGEVAPGSAGLEDCDGDELEASATDAIAKLFE